MCWQPLNIKCLLTKSIVCFVLFCFGLHNLGWWNYVGWSIEEEEGPVFFPFWMTGSNSTHQVSGTLLLSERSESVPTSGLQVAALFRFFSFSSCSHLLAPVLPLSWLWPVSFLFPQTGLLPLSADRLSFLRLCWPWLQALYHLCSLETSGQALTWKLKRHAYVDDFGIFMRSLPYSEAFCRYRRNPASEAGWWVLWYCWLLSPIGKRKVKVQI